MGFYSMELHKPFKSHGPQGPWRQKSETVCKGLEGLRGRGGKYLRPLGMGVGRGSWQQEQVEMEPGDGAQGWGGGRKGSGEVG